MSFFSSNNIEINFSVFLEIFLESEVVHNIKNIEKFNFWNTQKHTSLIVPLTTPILIDLKEHASRSKRLQAFRYKF